MQVSSDLPCPAESMPALSYPAPRAQRQPLPREYDGDEEFPADLPVEYDLQLHTGHGLRRTVEFLVVTLAMMLSGFALWGVHRFQKLALALGIAFAIVVFFAAARWHFRRSGA